MGIIENYREEIGSIKKIVLVGIIILGMIFLFNNTFKKVPAGYVGVLYNNLKGGTQLEEFNGGQEGWGFKYPIIESVIFVPTTTQTLVLNGLGFRDKNNLVFNWDISVRYTIDPKQAAEIIKTKGDIFEKNPISLIIQSEGPKIIEKYSQENVSQFREDISNFLIEQTQKDINEETEGTILQQNYITINSIGLGSINLMPEINKRLIDNEQYKLTEAQKVNEILLAKQEQERVIADTEAQNKKAEIDAIATANLEKIKVDSLAYSIQQEASAKADAIKKIGEAYRTVPNSYMLAKAYESIKSSDKIVIGLESITDATKFGIVGYVNSNNFVNTTLQQPINQPEGTQPTDNSVSISES